MDTITKALRMAAAALLGLLAVGLLFALPSAKSSAGGILITALVVGVGAFFLWPRCNSWRNDAPTERQLRYAADLGIRVRRGATKGEVSDLISQATGR